MFIYKTTHKDGRYYIGRCSRKHSDTYMGSGRWVRSIKDKSSLHRVIMSTHDSFEELCLAEEIAIEKHISDPLCMNWNNKSVGFGTGEHNPSYKGMRGRELSQEIKDKISESQKERYKHGWAPRKGKPMSDLAKQRSSAANSNTYEICHPDNRKEVVTNMTQWCKQNGHSDIVFHRRHKQGKPYKGMTYIKLPK